MTTVAEQAEIVKALKAGGKGNKDPEVIAAVKVLKELKAGGGGGGAAKPSAPASALAAPAADAAPAEAPKPKNTMRRDTLVDLEHKVQAQWEITKPYDADFPDDGTTGTEGEKWFQTFPYPYMNGRLHMGHAFSLTKCEYMIRFQVRPKPFAVLGLRAAPRRPASASCRPRRVACLPLTFRPGLPLRAAAAGQERRLAVRLPLHWHADPGPSCYLRLRRGQTTTRFVRPRLASAPGCCLLTLSRSVARRPLLPSSRRRSRSSAARRTSPRRRRSWQPAPAPAR